MHRSGNSRTTVTANNNSSTTASINKERHTYSIKLGRRRTLGRLSHYV
jgi:hypothetical protein